MTAGLLKDYFSVTVCGRHSGGRERLEAEVLSGAVYQPKGEMINNLLTSFVR